MEPPFRTDGGEDGRKGLSPEQGVILMVLITLILASVIGTFVFDLGQDISTIADTERVFIDADTINGTVKHQGTGTIIISIANLEINEEVLITEIIIDSGDEASVLGNRTNTVFVEPGKSTQIQKKIAFHRQGLYDVRVITNYRFSTNSTSFKRAEGVVSFYQDGPQPEPLTNYEKFLVWLFTGGIALIIYYLLDSEWFAPDEPPEWGAIVSVGIAVGFGFVGSIPRLIYQNFHLVFIIGGVLWITIWGLPRLISKYNVRAIVRELRR